MSGMWRDLLRELPPDLVGALTLDRVLTSRAGDHLTVCLFSEKLLNDAQYRQIKANLQSGFPGVRLSLRVTYPQLKEEALRDIGCVSEFVAGLMARENPATASMLLPATGNWRLTDNILDIDVADAMCKQFLDKLDAGEKIATFLKTLFGIRVKAHITVRGDQAKRLKAIADKRIEEDERIAENARRIAESAPVKDKPLPKELYGKAIPDPSIPIGELAEGSMRAVVTGEVLQVECRDVKNGQAKSVRFLLTDYTGTVPCDLFIGGKRGAAPDPEQIQKRFEHLTQGLKEGAWVTVRGDYRYDEYRREMTLRALDIVKAAAPMREDTAPVKRVELHLHTQMSAMDACASPTDLIKRAAAWGHPAIAITDHGVVQAFPEAFNAAKKNKIKLIPGCEGYLIDDSALIVENADQRKLADTAFVVLDVETTGLNPRTDVIIELGAVRYEHGREVGEFSQLINPGRAIPEKITELTGITDMMVAQMPAMQDVLPDFHKFLDGAVVCAHNASFDWSFLAKAFDGMDFAHAHPVLDTLSLSRNLLKGQKSHKLGAVCKTLGISLKNAHRAVHDARATAQALMIMLSRVDQAERLADLNSAFDGSVSASRHIILLARTQQGMANLYRLVSEGHLNHFYRTPRLPRALIARYREGLIVGSACESGELFQALLRGATDAELKRIAKFYDYLEVQPIDNNMFLVREGRVKDADALRAYNRRIVELGEQLNIPVVATGDVHFMEPHDAIYRTILLNAKGFDDADQQTPLYFRTTDDMLREFSYLGAARAQRIVVDTPRAIAETIEPLSVFLPHPEGKETFQPFWPDAESDIRRLTQEKCGEIYGTPLPEIVQARVDKELKSIIGYGFSTLYDIAVKLVKKSMDDGYIVGSRGSVGSSFVAWATGITEVNALPPHYVCPQCKHSEFDVPEAYTCGLDLPEKTCPDCGANMRRDGFNIPFEVFLGFKGDKVPDIDLNFSGEYQSRAHAYVKDLFGAENVFRAGTIGTIAEKTAYGYVLKYLEERNMTVPNAEKERLARGLTGVKRTTGQHPAGMVVLPRDYSIYQFTPIQHPADDMQSETVTTHFDFSSMHDVLVKLDILGHDDPTMLKKLNDLTGIKPQDVPLHDPVVFGRILSLFKSPETLGVTEEEILSPTGTLGVPEFGTRFVRQMLVDTKPSTMEELIRISGLSHGTDVWIGNAQDIIKSGTAVLRECVCTRDDIMNQLIRLGVESKMAFTTMEAVRKGRGLTDEMQAAMRAQHTPEWFIQCCQKIKYMFPKAHAVAYVTMALRIAYFKIYYPLQYYTCYLQRNIESFDALKMIAPLPIMKERLEDLLALDKDEKARKEGEITITEILIEMLSRHIELLPISLYESDAGTFRIRDGKILPPFTALPGLGLAAAENLARARDEGTFVSQEDMLRRKVSRGVIDLLKQAGALNNLPETSQVSLFDL